MMRYLRSWWELHPLLLTHIGSLFLALPLSFIVELIALILGAELVNQFVRETFVLIYTTCMSACCAQVGRSLCRKRQKEGDKFLTFTWRLYTICMTIVAMTIGVSMLIIVVDKVVAG